MKQLTCKKWLASLVGTVLLSNTHLAWCQIKEIESSTQALLQFSHQIKLGTKLNSAQINQMVDLAKIRQKAIAEELKTPLAESVSRFTLPKHVTTLLPKEIQTYVENEVTLVGELEIRISLNKNGVSEVQYILHKGNKYYYLHFSEKMSKNLKTGDKIKLKKAYQFSKTKGIYDIIVAPEDVSVTKANLAIPSSLGPQKTIVFAVNFQDLPSNQPWTISQINNSALVAVNNLYYEASYNQTTLEGPTVGWYTLAINSTTDCDTMTNQIPALAQQAAINAGVDLSSYKHRVYVFPQNKTCGWLGLGSVGTPTGTGYSHAWLNGTISTQVSGHELGHNLGLWHSRYIDCPNSPDQGSCTIYEYGDNTDTMGNTNAGHFNAFQKDRLGWLNYQMSPPIKTVTASGTYVIDPYETKNNNTKALKVLKQVLPNGSSDYYYLEYRQPIGFDAVLAACGTACDYTKGVVFHQGNSVNANSSDVLDMTPDHNNRMIALLPGQSFSNPNAPNNGVTFTVNSVSAAGASVKIQFGGSAPVCEHAAHTMNITPTTTQWINGGQSANYSVTIKNNDSTPCASSNYQLSTSVPTSLLKTTLSTQWLSLAPGSSNTFTVNIASTTGIPTAIYAVGVSSANTTTPGVSASVIANLGINP